MLKGMGLAFAIVGIILLLISGSTYRNTNRFIRDSRHATGRVIRFERKMSNSNNRGKYLFAPVIEFEIESGEKVQFVSSSASTDPGDKIGDKVDVLYNPRAPQSVTINTFWSLWFLPLFLGVLGTLFTIIGAILFALFLKETRSQRKLHA